MRLIMLGKLRSGKSTVTEMFVRAIREVHNITLEPRPLATPIYVAAKKFYEENGLVWRKNRAMLEAMGQALNEDYPQGDKIVELYDSTLDLKKNIIVEDCRRLTQTRYFKEKGAIFIRVKASDEIRKLRCKPGEWSTGHVTDTELDDWQVDFEIVNEGNYLHELDSKVQDIVKQLKV